MDELQRLLHDPVFSRLGLTLIHFLWQGLALALLACLLRSLLHQARPALRYLVLLALFAGMVAAPVLTFTLWAKAPLPAIMTKSELGTLLAAAARHRPVQAEELLAGAPRRPAVRPAPEPPLLTSAGSWARRVWWQIRLRLPAVGVLWALGVLVLSLRLLAQWALFARVVRGAVPLDGERWRQLLASLSVRLGVRRAVRLLQTAAATMPAAAGWLRPFVLLPPAVLLGLTPEQLEAVIAHELAHIRRHDYLVNVIQRIAEALLFYHPAVWWLSGVIRVEREYCCDDLAATVCGSSVSYARLLARLEDLREETPALATAFAQGRVMTRVGRLLLPVEADRRSLSWSAVLFPALALTSIALLSGLVPVRGEPYVRGTLLYGEAATAVGGLYWERGADTARVISGRTQWTIEKAAPFHLVEYSPRGDEVLFYQRNELPGGSTAGPTDIWKAELDLRGQPDFSRATNLVQRAGMEPADVGRGWWSPDGRQIVFIRVPFPAPVNWCHTMQLWVMDADGSGSHQVPLRPWRVDGEGVQWTPDSTHILVSVWDPKDPAGAVADYRTLLVDTKGQSITELPITSGAVSPDGSWIAGVWQETSPSKAPGDVKPDSRRHPTGTYRWEFLLVRPDGSGKRTLLSRSYQRADLQMGTQDALGAVTPSEFAWSPDGRQVAFVFVKDWDRKGPPVNRQRELFIYDLPTGRLTQVTHDNLEQCTPVWME